MPKKTLRCGHPKNEKNVYIWRGKSFCRECRRLYAYTRYHKKKDKEIKTKGETQVKLLERKLTPVEMVSLLTVSLLIHEHKKGNDILPILEDLRTQFIEDMLTKGEK